MFAPEWAEALVPDACLRSDWTPPVRRAWARAVLVFGRAFKGRMLGIYCARIVCITRFVCGS